MGVADGAVYWDKMNCWTKNELRVNSNILYNEQAFCEQNIAMNIEDIINYLKDANAKMTLRTEKNIILRESSITKHRTKLNDAPVYKLLASCDSNIIPILPKIMLGPSQEFATLCIVTGYQTKRGELVMLYGHLTSAVQRGSLVQLHIIIDDIAPRD